MIVFVFETVLILLTSPTHAGGRMVGLASTSTNHSPSVSGWVFQIWLGVKYWPISLRCSSSTWSWHGRYSNSNAMKVLWNYSHASDMPNIDLGINVWQYVHLNLPFSLRKCWVPQLWLFLFWNACLFGVVLAHCDDMEGAVMCYESVVYLQPYPKQTYHRPRKQWLTTLPPKTQRYPSVGRPFKFALGWNACQFRSDSGTQWCHGEMLWCYESVVKTFPCP